MTGFLVASVLLSALLGASCESHYGAMFQSLGKLGTNHDNKNQKPEIFSQMAELSMAEISGTINEAIKKVVEDDLLSTENISATCLQHLNMTWKAVTLENWANTMVDATGKPAPGLFLGNTFWTGQYDECVNVTAKVKVTNTSATTDMFNGRYCTIGIPLAPSGEVPIMDASQIAPGDIAIGLCVPSSCDIHDLKTGINKVISLLPYNWTHSGNMTTLSARDGTCQIETLEYDTRAVFAITLLSILGAVIVVATLYDMFVIHKLHRDLIVTVEHDSDETSPLIGTPNHETDSLDIRNRGYGSASGPITVRTDVKSPSIQEIQETGILSSGLCGRLLQSFSIYTNGPKLLDTRKQAGTLGAVHGIRFISMSWVILGHTYAFLAMSSQNILPFIMEKLNQLSFMAIINATVSVDTFFLLSGLLVSYLSLREMRKVEGAKNFRWVMFYFHRFWRLTPPYMLVMLLYIPLAKYWYNGPFWPQNGIEKNYCADTWWQNLLYINNFFPIGDMCMAWSWYLANDMQFYVISPIFLIPLYYSNIIGGIVSGTLLLASCIISGSVSKHYNLNLNLLSNNTNTYFEKYYEMPYCRIGPYIVGMLCGYILYKTDLRMRLSRKVQCVGWMVAAGCCLSVLYANFDSVNGKHPSSIEVMALYNALARTAWAVGVSWVILVCATGYGGWVNRFLSWSVFIPLSRLTYMAYLIHPVIMTLFNTGKRQIMYLTDIEISYLFLGHMCISYAVAFVLSMAFESPFMALEKALFNRNKKQS